MKTNLSSRVVRAAVPFALLGAAASSQAAGVTVDVADVLTSLTNAVATITSIGLATLSLVVVVRLFSWVRGALK